MTRALPEIWTIKKFRHYLKQVASNIVKVGGSIMVPAHFHDVNCDLSDYKVKTLDYIKF